MQKTLKILLCSLGVFLSLQANAEIDLSKTEREIDRTKSSLELKSADGNFSIGFMGYLQQNNAFNYLNTGVGLAKKDLKFELNAARIGFYGSAFHPSLTYFVQTGFEHDDGVAVAGSKYLRDYYLNYEAHKKVQLRIGKFGMPFGRQNMVLGSHQQFYKNSAASMALGEAGKSVGFMAHNGRNENVEWALALVSNGLVGRVGYNHGGIDGYELSDFNGGPLRFAVALNGAAQFGNYFDANLDNITYGADFLVKVKHFSTNGMFNHNFMKQGTDAGAHSFAAGLDMGYLMHGRYEPVLRYSFTKAKGDPNHEVLAGLNYYIYGQHLKVQGYAGADFGPASAWKLGAQFQFAL